MIGSLLANCNINTNTTAISCSNKKVSSEIYMVWEIVSIENIV